MSYQLGYKNGLKGSPEYADALEVQERLRSSEAMDRLVHLLAQPPSVEACVPVMAGQEIDEYSFCSNLLADQENERYEGAPDRDMEYR